MPRPANTIDYIENLHQIDVEKSSIVSHKIKIICDVCKNEGDGFHIWIEEPIKEDRLEGYDYVSIPNNWLTLWTENGNIYVCSHICACRLDTNVFY